jgi:V/A-type H+-transporting ATPase subunit I
MIIPMAKIRIVGPKSRLEEVTELLQALGVVHIESTPRYTEAERLERFFLDPDHQKKRAKMETALRDLNQLILALPEVQPDETMPDRFEEGFGKDDEDFRQIREAIDAAKSGVDSLLNQIRECEEEQSLVAKYEHALEALAPLLHQIQESQELDYVGLVLEAPSILGGDGGVVLQEIRQALSDLTENHYELFVVRVDPETLAGLLVIPRELSTKVRAFLWGENISELRLPSYVSDKPVGEALQILLRRRVELPQQLEQLRWSLRTLSFQWRERLLAYKRIVENRLAQLESTVNFYQTRSTFLVYGWVPEGTVPVVQQRLSESLQGSVVMEKMKIAREEIKNIPVALKNPPLVSAFENFTRMVALPRYGSIDPTPYVAVFFPIFFGVILGDIGYGMVLLGFSLYARKRWGSLPLIRDFSAIFVAASLSAILFGFLYGEFFGELGEIFGIHPLLVNRMEGFLVLLQIAIGMGLVHVLLGIFLGLRLAIRHQDTREIILKGCGLSFLVGVFIFVGSLVDFLSQPYGVAGGIVALVSLFSLFALGGARGAMELHNVVNVLSYLRLMGIGVASAALAFAANTLGGLVGNVILGALITLFFHLINIVFGVFSPTIQSLRLHYVEFFENFFQPGGREYRPFRKV